MGSVISDAIRIQYSRWSSKLRVVLGIDIFLSHICHQAPSEIKIRKSMIGNRR